jgi:hypothetical protein
MKGQLEMGRFSVELVVANNRDMVIADQAGRPPETVKRVSVSAVVDSGAARLVLPQGVVSELKLQDEGEATVRYADQRHEKRRMVGNVWLELLGRHGVFSAVVEPNRLDALIGAIVLEELDLLVDYAAQSLYPREPDSILAEIE